MAYSNALTGRMEELRYGNIRSPGVEAPFTSTVTSNRDSNPFFAPIQQPVSNDNRATLQRRFTTDSSKTTMARPFGQQYTGMNANALKNQQMYEEIQKAKRKTEETLRMLEEQEAKLQRGVAGSDLESINTRINRISLNGPVSEPTTPPEYAESGLTTRYSSRSGRLSMNSMVSPPGLSSRMSQSSTQITSPSGNRLSGNTAFGASQKPAKSMPVSRRGSDEEDDYAEDLPTTRSAAVFNRFSMPVSGVRNQQRFSMAAAPSHNSLGPLNTTSFLFDDSEEKHLSLNGLDLKSPIAKTFAQLEGEDFPTLTSNGSRLSANSAALDLANPKSSDSESWAFGGRIRPAHQSMPQTDSSMYRPVLGNLNNPASDRPAELPRRKSQRHSMGITFEDSGEYDASTMPTIVPVARPASLQTSYSTNDVPTVKQSLNADNLMTPQKNQVGQQFHNHNVSLGRIPVNGVSNRHSREVNVGHPLGGFEEKTSAPALSGLQASAAPFGPGFTPSIDYSSLAMTSPTSNFTTPQTYAHNMQTYSISQMNGGPAGNGYQGQGQGQGMYGVSNGYSAYGKGQEAARGAGGRRNNDEARFNNVPLESYIGGLYELCKDQHGCRYLQRKLEEGNSEHIEAIFAETCPHIIELMTDPFGNYLCQKLFEHCNEEQRTTLINTAAPALTVIALNQHGTRALQKMIEFVHTNEQVETIVQSLSERVVELVQDLNGNHVVQKCLTRLGAERCQFIYDAVGNFCVIVGTHRHGCCVLQRCIDHAQGFQRAQLIQRITNCAFELVQDPFGNYVVQYILDLDEPAFTEPLCMAFQTKVVALSKQKFSSNVIEKCLRTAEPAPKRMMVEEMMMGNELEKMLRDSFANYVVQTAIDHSDIQTKTRLVDAIRPILPAIKQTPHGRRIATKILGSADGPGRVSGTSSGQMTPIDNFSPPFSTGSTGRSGGRRHIQIVGGGFNGPRSNGYAAAAENVDSMASAAYPAPYGLQMNEATNASMNGFSPQVYGVNASTRFGGYQNGQVGGNYI